MSLLQTKHLSDHLRALKQPSSTSFWQRNCGGWVHLFMQHWEWLFGKGTDTFAFRHGQVTHCANVWLRASVVCSNSGLWCKNPMLCLYLWPPPPGVSCCYYKIVLIWCLDLTDHNHPLHVHKRSLAKTGLNQMFFWSRQESREGHPKCNTLQL